MFRNCQVCGNPIFSVNDCGTDGDGRFNRDYCSNCYKSGHFYARDPVGDNDAPFPVPFAGMAAGGDGFGMVGGGGFGVAGGIGGIGGGIGVAGSVSGGIAGGVVAANEPGFSIDQMGAF